MTGAAAEFYLIGCAYQELKPAVGATCINPSFIDDYCYTYAPYTSTPHPYSIALPCIQRYLNLDALESPTPTLVLLGAPQRIELTKTDCHNRILAVR